MASVRKAQVYACGSYMDRCFTSNINLSNGPVAFSENMRNSVVHRSSWSGWWYTYPSEKYEFVSWDYDIPNIWKVMKFMFQTTNQ